MTSSVILRREAPKNLPLGDGEQILRFAQDDTGPRSR